MEQVSSVSSAAGLKRIRNNSSSDISNVPEQQGGKKPTNLIEIKCNWKSSREWQLI